MQSRKKNEGISIVGILLIGVVAIFVLSYFKIDIKGVVESPTAQENVGYVKEGSKTVWEKYLKEPAEYLWNDIFVDLLWGETASRFLLTAYRISASIWLGLQSTSGFRKRSHSPFALHAP